MIMANPSAKLVPTVLACAAFLVLVGTSLTRPISAQPAAVPAATNQAPYRVTDDRFAALFPTGIVVAVGGKEITVEEIRHEIAPLISQLQNKAYSQAEFDLRLEQLRNNIITQRVERALLIKEFHENDGGEGAKHIPETFIDKAVADDLANKFDHDQSKFEAYLKQHGWTMADYRKMVEENIIFGYMTHQERKLAK